MNEVGELIKQYRLDNELTQEQFAETLNAVLAIEKVRSHYSRGAVCNWEHGRSYPDRAIIDVLAGSLSSLRGLFKKIQEMTK